MRTVAGLGLTIGLALLAGCGGGGTQHDIEERPLDQATALTTLQEALAGREVQSTQFVDVTLPDGSPWTVDIVGTSLPVAIEYLTEQDRQRIGDKVPIQATPDETPHVVIIRRAGFPEGEGTLYLRVFTDQHFRFQPNPPSDMPEAPYTMREVQARLRRDVQDFLSWYRANYAAPAAAAANP
jgi:hypothetical protein